MVAVGVAQALAQLEERGWTLTAVADELGVKLLTLYRWRDGNHHPEDPDHIISRIRELGTRERKRKPRGHHAPER